MIKSLISTIRPCNSFPLCVCPQVLGVINWVGRRSLVGIYECEPEKPGEGVKVSGYLWLESDCGWSHAWSAYEMMVMMMTCNATKRKIYDCSCFFFWYLFRFIIQVVTKWESGDGWWVMGGDDESWFDHFPVAVKLHCDLNLRKCLIILSAAVP